VVVPLSRGAGARLRTGRRVALISTAASCILAAANIAIGLHGGSTSVVAAGLEFLGDVLASTLVFAGMWFAARPADSNHPYGHGRIEILAGLSVGVILVAGGVGICYHSLQRVDELHPPPELFTVWPLAFAIVVRSVMSTVKFRVGRRIQSESLIADAWNDAVDILSASAALTALGLTLHDPVRFLAADHYGGFAVGLFVIFTGMRVIRDTSLQLMDTMPDELMIDQIRQAALSVPGVMGVEKCFARRTGLQFHVDIHIAVDPFMTVFDSHEIATAVRSRMRGQLGWVADVLVHVEPDPGSQTS
jgi:cation diffusion facilitator family transporter